MSDIWLSPPDVSRAVGPFDLDPCAAPSPRPWATAAKHYDITRGENGLELPWAGTVWLNPPYSDPEPWFDLLAEHRRGISLTFVRSSAPWFVKQVFDKADGLFFITHHLYFYHPDGTRAKHNGGAPSVLSAYGEEMLARLARCELKGRLWCSAAMVLRRGDGTPVGSWKEAVEASLAGRTLELRSIYAAAEGTAKVREAKAAGHNWRAQIRRSLQRHFAAAGAAVWSPA